MSLNDEELKNKLMEEDPEYRALAEEHEEFERQLEEFNRKPYLTPAEEALPVLAAISAIYRSARSGQKEPVSLSR